MCHEGQKPVCSFSAFVLCNVEQAYFDDIRAQYADLLQDSRDSMRNLMWHRNQKALSDFVIAILDEPRT